MDKLFCYTNKETESDLKDKVKFINSIYDLQFEGNMGVVYSKDNDILLFPEPDHPASGKSKILGFNIKSRKEKDAFYLGEFSKQVANLTTQNNQKIIVYFNETPWPTYSAEPPLKNKVATIIKKPGKLERALNNFKSFVAFSRNPNYNPLPSIDIEENYENYSYGFSIAGSTFENLESKLRKKTDTRFEEHKISNTPKEEENKNQMDGFEIVKYVQKNQGPILLLEYYPNDTPAKISFLRAPNKQRSSKIRLPK